MIDGEVAQRQEFHSLQDEVDDIPGGHPFAQIAGQKHRRLAGEIDETCRYAGWILPAAFLFILFSRILRRLSPTGCSGLEAYPHLVVFELPVTPNKMDWRLV